MKSKYFHSTSVKYNTDGTEKILFPYITEYQKTKICSLEFLPHYGKKYFYIIFDLENLMIYL